MKDNILIDDTVKIFENGVEEIKKLKRAIIKLNDTVGELTNFNEILELQIDKNKIEYINIKLQSIVDKHNEALNSFEYCIDLINDENKIKTDNIKLGMDKFIEDTEKVSKKLNFINTNIKDKATDKLLKDINNFINDLENQYKHINEKYETIENMSAKADTLLEVVKVINNKLEDVGIEKKIADSLNRISELDLKYQSIIKAAEKFDNTINIFNENLNTAIDDIENSNITVKSEAILDDFKKFKDNIKKEYESIETRYDDMNLLQEKIDKNIEYINSKGEQIFLRLENQLEKYVTNIEVIEEIKKSTSSDTEEKIKILEKKIDYLIEENKELKILQTNRAIEEDKFKKDIINLIKDTMFNAYQSIRDKRLLNDSDSINIEKLKELAKQGDINSSFILANKYYKGENANKSIELAIRYYMMGAKKNHIESKEEIIRIYKEEANNGSVKYQKMLGIEYLNGDLVQENIDEAIKWLNIASENGSKEAKNRLMKIMLHKNMSTGLG